MNKQEHAMNTQEHAMNTEEHAMNTEEHAMNTEELATVHVEWQGDLPVIRVEGELDTSNAERIGISITELAGGSVAYVVDISLLGYLDSSALTMLHRLAQQPAKLHLATQPGSRSARLIEIGGLDTALATYPSREAAIAAASG